MSKLNKQFEAALQQSPNKGGWTYVIMPGSVEYFGTPGPREGSRERGRKAIRDVVHGPG